MTRIVVAREGEKINNCIIMPGALRCEDDVIPVDWNGNKDQLIGKASQMERNEETNEISFEIELREGFHLDLEDHIEGFVFVSPFESNPHKLMPGAIAEVTSGRIRQVSLADSRPAANPAAPKED